MWVVPGGRGRVAGTAGRRRRTVSNFPKPPLVRTPPLDCVDTALGSSRLPTYGGLDTNRLSLGARGARYRYTDVRRSDRDVRAADRGPTVGRAHTHAQNIRSRSHTPGGASASTPTPRASSLTDPLKAPPTAQRPLARSSLTHYSPTRRHAAARLAALPRESSLL